MRQLLLFLLLIVFAFALNELRAVQRRVARSVANPTAETISDNMILQLQKERKERRLLRKKKQKLKELREEIRQLSMQRRRPESATLLEETVRKPKKDARWKRKLIEKLKGIVRRLDRIEKQKSPVNKVRVVTAIEPTVMVTTTAASSSTTPLIKTSISTPAEDTKMRRIQSSIEQARSGENGTACGSHSDCRPGRCCQRTASIQSGPAVCTFFSLPENEPCTDSCQCAHRLLCFYPKDNSTKPYCKKAQSSDITSGVYLQQKDGLFAVKKKKK